MYATVRKRRRNDVYADNGVARI